MKTTILSLKHSIKRSRRPLALLLILLAFACFARVSEARATCHDGCDQTRDNTFLGNGALGHNPSGFSDTAIGAYALIGNISGSYNTAAGFFALSDNTTGGENTATGAYALEHNTTGSNNIALGNGGGTNLTTGSNNIAIGSAGVAAEANTIRIWTAGTQQATYIAGISGTAVAGGVGVIVDTEGYLGTVVSSERFKDQIRPMDKASEAVLALKPVTFRYKHELDPKGIPQFGLVAEDVEKVNADLVARDEQGKPYTVRYEAVNAMLLNEFLKEDRKVEKLESALLAVNARLAEQDAKIQKVNAQLELNKAAPQTVLNNR